ncbi:hypothetical protein, partial [Klebsiella pneumoniae]|uniref:hypothetical protein n=1 Tax=Klebsiella pneumoniae TaxID=573 RepID=UPI003B5C2B65
EGRLRALEAEEEALRQERATWRNRLEAEREALRQGLEAARRALGEVGAEAQEALRQRKDRWREVARERLGKLLEDRKGEREALASYLVAERARWEAEWERRELERLLGERQRELEALRQEGEARWPKELGGTLWEFLEGALPGWRDTVGRVVRP